MSAYPAENRELARKLNAVAWVLTVVVLGLVGLMRRVKIDVDVDFSFLPGFHAFLNGVTAIVLILAFVAVRRGKIDLHKKMMVTAIVTSTLFLLSYVIYHFTTPETAFCKTGTIRLVYFILLISHIIFAAIIFPFILFTLIRGLTWQVDRHKKMAKWVFPIWLYVAVSGPIVYLMLKPCYG